MAPYWSQKDGIAAYYKHRRSPEEKLVAYQMYWRGETFYTKNEIYEGPTEDRTVFDMDDADENLKSCASGSPATAAAATSSCSRTPASPGPLRPARRGPADLPHPRAHQQQVHARRRRPVTAPPAAQNTKGMSTWRMRSLRVFMGASMPWA